MDRRAGAGILIMETANRMAQRKGEIQCIMRRVRMFRPQRALDMHQRLKRSDIIRKMLRD